VTAARDQRSQILDGDVVESVSELKRQGDGFIHRARRR